jgi:hypothetical protein
MEQTSSRMEPVKCEMRNKKGHVEEMAIIELSVCEIGEERQATCFIIIFIHIHKKLDSLVTHCLLKRI